MKERNDWKTVSVCSSDRYICQPSSQDRLAEAIKHPVNDEGKNSQTIVLRAELKIEFQGLIHFSRCFKYG